MYKQKLRKLGLMQLFASYFFNSVVLIVFVLKLYNIPTPKDNQMLPISYHK